MIKISEDRFKVYEQNYPGITEQILRYEAANLPACPQCGAADTAIVIGALVGRTIHLASATTKVHLTPNGSSQGTYYCNTCKAYFNIPGSERNTEAKTKPIFSRPSDNSWQAYRAWVLSFTAALTGKLADDTYSEDEWKQYAAKFWSTDNNKH